jgi:hypothetical protein
MTLGSTQCLTEMSIRNLPGAKGRPAPSTSRYLVNVGTSTSHNPTELHGSPESKDCLMIETINE